MELPLGVDAFGALVEWKSFVSLLWTFFLLVVVVQ